VIEMPKSSTLSPPDLPTPTERHSRRWRRLHDERRFRIEQLAELEAEPTAGQRHDAVKGALRIAARAALAEIEAALERAAHGRYGLCVNCDQPIPDGRLDVLPMAALCMPCHFNEQNRHATVSQAEV
jgi:RNA polymerase-binding transcription factor DksA